MNEPAIDLQAVYKSFRSTEVLRGVTLQVERGKTFAFLGRNAAGKTTTIRMLLGLLKRDDGAIRVLGLDPQREPLELRRRVGYLAEDQTMYGWMRVEEIVRFVAPFYPTWDHDLALQVSARLRAAAADADQAPVQRPECAARAWCSRWPIGRSW